MKSWLARGSSGRLVPGTVFRINGTCSVDIESTAPPSTPFILCDSLAFDWFCMASKANKFILFFIDLFHISLKAHKCCIKQVKICRKLCRYATVVDYL